MDDEIDRMSRVLQEANRSYSGYEFNLHAFWRHLATAALATLAQRGKREPCRPIEASAFYVTCVTHNRPVDECLAEIGAP